MNPRLSHQRVTGHSGNEIFCLHQIGMRAGQLCLGNSVLALGAIRGLGAGLKALAGGEVEAVTALICQSRSQAFNTLLAEARAHGSHGVTGVSFDLINHGSNFEFIALGSGVYRNGAIAGTTAMFSTAGDAQQLFCLVDAGFDPVQFVFGNVAYSIGVGGNLSGWLRGFRRGEVPQYTAVFDKTRHLALQRLRAEAKRCGANAVVGIQTTIAPILGAQEMAMLGTAVRHAGLPSLASAADVITSDMTPEEQWNMAHLGYLPLQLVMGVSVYALGFMGGWRSFFQSMAGGSVDGLTEILTEAREMSLARIEKQAEACGADEVVGVKIRVYDLGYGLVEVLAIGTAVRKVAGTKTASPSLPAQAIIVDRDTLVDSSRSVALSLAAKSSARRSQGGPLRLIIGTTIFLLYFINALYKLRSGHP